MDICITNLASETCCGESLGLFSRYVFKKDKNKLETRWHGIKIKTDGNGFAIRGGQCPKCNKIFIRKIEWI